MMDLSIEIRSTTDMQQSSDITDAHIVVCPRGVELSYGSHLDECINKADI